MGIDPYGFVVAVYALRRTRCDLVIMNIMMTKFLSFNRLAACKMRQLNTRLTERRESFNRLAACKMRRNCSGFYFYTVFVSIALRRARCDKSSNVYIRIYDVSIALRRARCDIIRIRRSISVQVSIALRRARCDGVLGVLELHRKPFQSPCGVQDATIFQVNKL